MKKLVVFYSYTGHTKMIAENIQRKFNCDILEIKPVKPYSTDYQTVVDEEQNNSSAGKTPDIQKVKNRDKKEGRTACEPIVKYREMFNRRLKKGQCWHQPYLGTREFSCDFFPVTQEDLDKATELNLTYPIGSLLFDIWYDKDHNATPIYMTNAVIKNSTLVCPDELNEKMLSTSHVRAKQEDSVNRILFDFNRKEELCSQN